MAWRGLLRQWPNPREGNLLTTVQTLVSLTPNYLPCLANFVFYLFIYFFRTGLLLGFSTLLVTPGNWLLLAVYLGIAAVDACLANNGKWVVFRTVSHPSGDITRHQFDGHLSYWSWINTLCAHVDQICRFKKETGPKKWQNWMTFAIPKIGRLVRTDVSNCVNIRPKSASYSATKKQHLTKWRKDGEKLGMKSIYWDDYLHILRPISQLVERVNGMP